MTSTVIKSTLPGSKNTVEVSVDACGEVYLDIGSRPAGIAVNGLELLHAIERELNVLVIDKAVLPKVHSGNRHYFTKYYTENDSVLNTRSADADTNTADLRSEAYALLALAEAKDAEPPVSNAQVAALRRVLGSDIMAYDAVAAGWTNPKVGV